MHKLIHAAACLLLLLLAPGAIAQRSGAGASGTPVATTVRVSFADGSSVFRPGADEAATLADAKGAALVVIRGRTSTSVPSPQDEAMALARAVSARAYLVARGVSPLKISINYASAADFISDNSTSEGRLQNQRVEIDMISVPTIPEVSAWCPECDASAPPAAPRKPPVAKRVWEVRKSDANVQRMLTRWGKDEGWTVNWPDALEIRITGNEQVEQPDFLSAADMVIRDAQAKGYPIKAKAFADNVLEIKKVTK